MLGPRMSGQKIVGVKCAKCSLGVVVMPGANPELPRGTSKARRSQLKTFQVP